MWVVFVLESYYLHLPSINIGRITLTDTNTPCARTPWAPASASPTSCSAARTAGPPSTASPPTATSCPPATQTSSSCCVYTNHAALAPQVGRMRDGLPQRGRVRGPRHQGDRALVLHQGDRGAGGRGADLPRGLQHRSAGDGD